MYGRKTRSRDKAYGITDAHELTPQPNEAYGITDVHKVTIQSNEPYGITGLLQNIVFPWSGSLLHIYMCIYICHIPNTQYFFLACLVPRPHSKGRGACRTAFAIPAQKRSERSDTPTKGSGVRRLRGARNLLYACASCILQHC